MKETKNISSKISKAKWDSSWKSKAMDYEDREAISKNTLSKGYVGK